MKHTPLVALVWLALAATPVRAEEPPADPGAAQPSGAATPSGDAAAAPKPTVEEANAACLSCHGDPEMSITLKDGHDLSLGVGAETFAASVHGTLGCTDCHADLKGADDSGHAKKRFKTAREFAVNFSENCKACHSDNYQKTLDSVHHAQIVKGNLSAAVCADCHGAHDVAKGKPARAVISRTCAKCHEKESSVFAQSVHGKALLDEGNLDVPACTDCHRSHDIVSPKTGAWRLGTPMTCGGCHADANRMKKYGISTDVLKTYLADFHGTTVSLQNKQKDAYPVVALCSDCHGVHDIKKVNDPDSRVIQTNLVKTCQKCHPDATPNFPKAWLSHYQPTLSKTPLVAAVGIFYRIFVPFVIGGLVLQILLHLWRVVVNR